MSDGRPELYATVVRAIADARGLDLPEDDVRGVAEQAATTLDGFRRLAAELRADDDVHTFRRLLQIEASHD